MNIRINAVFMPRDEKIYAGHHISRKLRWPSVSKNGFDMTNHDENN
jgi:hypothetical protein